MSVKNMNVELSSPNESCSIIKVTDTCIKKTLCRQRDLKVLGITVKGEVAVKDSSLSLTKEVYKNYFINHQTHQVEII